MPSKHPDSAIPQNFAPIIVGGAIRGRLTLQPGSVLTDNEHGIDTLSRTYFAFSDEWAKLSPRKGDKDKGYPTMRLTDRTFTEGRGLTGFLSLTFRGLYDDKIPDVVIKGGWSEQTAQLGVTTGAGGNTVGLLIGHNVGNGLPNANTTDLPANLDQSSEVSITYRAPKTTFLYVQRKKPTAPKYTGQLLSSIADFSVVEMRPARVFGRPVGIIVVRTTSFDVETAGSYWQCTEVSQAMLIPADAVQFGGRFNAGQTFPIAQIRVR